VRLAFELAAVILAKIIALILLYLVAVRTTARANLAGGDARSSGRIRHADLLR
jgi:hypothetical protein